MKKIIKEKEGYGTVQRDFMQMDISVYAKCVYTLLRTYSGQKDACYPSMKTICDDLRISKSTLIRAIKELEEVEMIAVRRTKKDGSKENSVNTYIPLSIMIEVDVEKMRPADKQDGLGGTPQTPRGTPQTPGVVSEEYRKSNSIKNNIEEGLKPEKISGDMSDSEKAEYYVSKFNSMVVVNGSERKFKSSNAIKSSLKARIKDGYTLKDILKAIKCAMRDEFHFKTKYKHLTPQFFLRQDKLDKFLNSAENEEIIEENKKEIYENPYDQYGATN